MFYYSFFFTFLELNDLKTKLIELSPTIQLKEINQTLKKYNIYLDQEKISLFLRRIDHIAGRVDKYLTYHAFRKLIFIFKVQKSTITIKIIYYVVIIKNN